MDLSYLWFIKYNLIRLIITRILHECATKFITPYNYHESYKGQNMHDSSPVAQFSASNLRMKWESIWKALIADLGNICTVAFAVTAATFCFPVQTWAQFLCKVSK